MTEFTENQYLNRYRRDVKSQFGEDGIVEKIFEIIPKNDCTKWSCEFGAWDGKHCSNTYNLLVNKGWSGVLIEADPRKFRELQKTYLALDQAILINTFVDINGDDVLDRILSGTKIPKMFDLLSIDIDGADYHIWNSLQEYRPKVVIIEFNPTMPNNIEFVQEADPSKKHGSSILSLTRLATRKGYELICINAENAFYVDREYYPLFRIQDNSIEALKYYREPIQVFQLFDGTLVFQGEPSQSLIWYNLPVDFNKLQILPKFVRDAGVPWGGNRLYRALIKMLRIYRQRFWSGIDKDPGAWKM